MTQIVIPLRGDRVAGDLDAVDPTQLIDAEVIAELRTRADLGIEDRKAIIAFIERVIEERTEVIAEERAAIEEEQQAIDERRAEIEETIAESAGDEAVREERAPAPAPAAESDDEPGEPAVSTAVGQPPAAESDAPAAASEEETPPAGTPEPETPEVTAEPADEASTPAPADDGRALEEEQQELDRREADLEERRTELDEEEADLETLTEEVEDLYQETADDQTAIQEGIVPRDIVPFVRSVGGGYELVAVDIASLSLAGEQTIPVARQELVPYQGGILVVHARSNRLIHLEPTALEILGESDVTVVPGARIVLAGQRIFTVIPDAGPSRIGEFDAQLVLQRRSAETVDRGTDIVVRGDRLLVQGSDGEFLDLAIEDFR
jgi:hypothetical protein